MLRAENLVKRYGKGEAVIYAVNHISLEFRDGEFCAVVGKSGSGKTTLLNILGGLLAPEEGRVLYHDQDLYKLGDKKLSTIRRNGIATIFQTYNLLPDMSAEGNILLPAHLDKREIDQEFFRELVGNLGIEDRLTHMPSELSGGQQQRVAIARGLMNRPEILLCDEPTGNLDKRSSEDVIALLKKVNQIYGTTIIVVTHDQTIAEQADRIIRISDGRVEE